MAGVVPPPTRHPGSLPFPGEAPGTVNTMMPFDHVVVVMMENHSFDNLLGALSTSRADVDGLTFGFDGSATNSNPGTNHTASEVLAFPFPNTAQGKNVSQSWAATHVQIAGGQMNGFVRSAGAPEPMGYYTPEVLPFAYSLANAFTVANRWFCSVPGPDVSKPPVPPRRHGLRRHRHRPGLVTRFATTPRDYLRPPLRPSHFTGATTSPTSP